MKVFTLSLIPCLARLACGEKEPAEYLRPRKLQDEAVYRPNPLVVGDKISTMIDPTENSAIKPEVSEDGSYMVYEVLFRKGASYTAVHFKDFDMGQRCSMRVSGKDLPDGTTQVYKMTGLGKMDLGTFWAQHVKGDTMTIEIRCAPNALAAMHFEIDEIAVGFVDDGPELTLPTESVCGTFDGQNAVCYAGTIQYTKARAVARMLINGQSLCTGWMVGPNGYLLTNHHCLSTSVSAANTDFDFGAEAPTCSTSNCQLCHKGTVISGATFIQASAALDYALLRFTASSPQSTYGFLEIDDRAAILNEQIYIPQHPNGRAKEFGIVSTHSQNPGGFCKIDSVTQAGCTGTTLDIGYYCDTEGGSSGSPVLATSSNKVIALHHCRGNIACTQTGADPNRAVPITLINAQIGGIIGTPPTSTPMTPTTPGPTRPPTQAPTPIPTPSCAATEKVFTLDFTSDLFGSETTWSLVDNCSGHEVKSNGPYPSGEITQYIEIYCVPDGQKYTFTMFDSFGDGICCDFGSGSYNIFYDGTLRGSGSTFTSSKSHSFGTCNTPAPTPKPTFFPTPLPTPVPSTCFSEEATAQVQSKGQVKMSELVIGDKVLTASGYQTLYAFAHNDIGTNTEFLQIHTDEYPSPLEITGQHLLFTVDEPYAVPAHSIKPGDLLKSSIWQDGVRVKSVRTVYRDGIYAPLTTDGTLVVDGVVSSCYVVLQKNDGNYVELTGGISTGLSQHFFAHIAMTPVRLACTGISPSMCDFYDQGGLAYFVKIGFASIDFANNLSLPIQLLLLTMFFLVFGPIFFLESLIGSKLVLLLAMCIGVALAKCFSGGKQKRLYYETCNH